MARAEVIAKVDGQEITSGDLALVRQDVGRSLSKRLPAALRNAYLTNYLIDMKLAARKAEQEKLHESEALKKRMAYYRQKALMEVLMDKIKKDAASKEAIQKIYDEAKKKAKPVPEVKARHILVPTEKEALAALKRVRGGENFAKVATELSKDKAPGGDLGWFTRNRMVKEFADVAFKTEPGKISYPVKSKFGWHIIKVEGKRTKAFPKLEQVRGQIEGYLARKAQRDAVTALRKAAKVERMGAKPAAPGAGLKLPPAAKPAEKK